jgi:hypothetical protein
MPMILPADDYAAMLTAADAAGSTRVRARVSWLIANRSADAPPATSIRPGTFLARLRCSPPPCVELWAASDADLSSDWEVG